MVLAITICACVVVLPALILAKRTRDRRKLERYTIAPETLYALLTSSQEVLVFDVRLPLDMLADSVTIPGAQWFAPEEVRANPSLLPKERDLVVYCTCPSDRTSRIVLRRALAMGFVRIKFLKGGLDGWRTSGFPVEPYRKPFHLNSDKSGATHSNVAVLVLLSRGDDDVFRDSGARSRTSVASEHTAAEARILSRKRGRFQMGSEAFGARSYEG